VNRNRQTSTRVNGVEGRRRYVVITITITIIIIVVVFVVVANFRLCLFGVLTLCNEDDKQKNEQID
jgi:hypothetical protein